MIWLRTTDHNHFDGLSYSTHLVQISKLKLFLNVCSGIFDTKNIVFFMHRQLIAKNHDKKQANSKLAVIRSPTPNHNKFGLLDTCIITILILLMTREIEKLHFFNCCAGLMSCLVSLDWTENFNWQSRLPICVLKLLKTWWKSTNTQDNHHCQVKSAYLLTTTALWFVVESAKAKGGVHRQYP